MTEPAVVEPSFGDQAKELRWYHTFDLPGGVTTEGLFDHREWVRKVPIPQSLAGLRCLDAAASDGFFGFEMARRGAAEVVSLDLPDHDQQDFSGPPKERRWWVPVGRANRCFDLVRRATGLAVERVDGSIYEMDRLNLGRFDFVFLGNVLIHLRDPVGALQALRPVVAGQLMSVEPISGPDSFLRPRSPAALFSLDDDNTFWVPNLAGHRRIVEAGGFQVTSSCRVPSLQPLGEASPRWSGNRPRTIREATYWGFTRPFGKLTSWVLASPLA